MPDFEKLKSVLHRMIDRHPHVDEATRMSLHEDTESVHTEEVVHEEPEKEAEKAG